MTTTLPFTSSYRSQLVAWLSEFTIRTQVALFTCEVGETMRHPFISTPLKLRAVTSTGELLFEETPGAALKVLSVKDYPYQSWEIV